jgi:methionyl-tRNA formyltransferase
MKTDSKQKIAFWGTPQFAVTILGELEKKGITPSLVVTTPDTPQGRKLTVTPSPVKVWALEHNILVLNPHRLNDPQFLETLKSESWGLFIVAAYGKIIPSNVLAIPKYGSLNVHPSLLPKLRGPSPIETAIIEDMKDTGVSIMLLDEEMDHGPILASWKLPLAHEKWWPPKASALEAVLAHEGGKLLAETIKPWCEGKLKALPQEHPQATYTKKITKKDGLLDLNDDPYKNYRKIRAFDTWPRAYFFVTRNGKKVRVVVSDALYSKDQLLITKVVPEGKREMTYEDFLRGSNDL